MADEQRPRPDPDDVWGPTTRIGTGDVPPAVPTPPAAPTPAPTAAEQYLPPTSEPYAPPESNLPPAWGAPTPPWPAAPAPAAPPVGPPVGPPTSALPTAGAAPSLPPAAPPSLASPTSEPLPPRTDPAPPDPFDPRTPPGPTSGVVPPPAPPTDELPLGRRFARKMRRGDQRDALRDAVSTVEARVPADFRIAILTGVLAIAAAIVQRALFPVSAEELTKKLIGYGLALVFLVLGIVAVRSTANELARVSTLKGGRTAAAAIRVTTLLVGYLLVALVTLGIIDVRLGNLLVGGALTGVIIGIAAQQALGNVFAGLVLLFSRPYVPGERIRVNSGSIGGPHDGVVVSVGLTYTVLLTTYGPLNLPNSQLLAAAIGPQPPDEDVANGTGDDGSEDEDRTTSTAAGPATPTGADVAGSDPAVPVASDRDRRPG